MKMESTNCVKLAGSILLIVATFLATVSIAQMDESQSNVEQELRPAELPLAGSGHIIFEKRVFNMYRE
jgi:hypothetical protein